MDGHKGRAGKWDSNVLKADAERVINTCQCHQEAGGAILARSPCLAISLFFLLFLFQPSVTMPFTSLTASNLCWNAAK